jgi:D-arabinose 1-dehydrogenase-like Zn-dependent alcohol dehydrogenase
VKYRDGFPLPQATSPAAHDVSKSETATHKKGAFMNPGEKLVIVGCSGAGGPCAMLAKKLMPQVDVTVIRKEEYFIVR